MQYTPDYAQNIGMIAGGTGITPMLVRFAFDVTRARAELTCDDHDAPAQQIIRAIVKNPLDRTNVSLIYANVNESDILLKKELDELAQQHSDRFKVYYVLNNPPEGWTGGVGFVTKEMIEEHLPAHAEDHKALLCGALPHLPRFPSSVRVWFRSSGELTLP